MTNREAYERDCNELEQYREIGTVEQVRNQKHNLEMAYKIISDYEAIGTVEECRKAIKKQKTRKKIYPKTALEKYYHSPKCPNCKKELRSQICGYTLPQAIGLYEYCPWCGQKLEDRESEEE